MCGGEFLKCLCVFLTLGLAVEAQGVVDPKTFNVTTLRRPDVSAPRSMKSNAVPFWEEDFCLGLPDMTKFAHPNCDQFYICWDEVLYEDFCQQDFWFDYILSTCVPADEVNCWDGGDDGPDDEECPPAGSNEIRFIPSVYCDEYYICINGNPVLFFCREGQHWNIEREYCDDPGSAGCDPDAPPTHPDALPVCNPGINAQFPHPHNCNWFIHCNNGNRIIQQCQHLHHFDVFTSRCLFKRQATCIKDLQLG